MLGKHTKFSTKAFNCGEGAYIWVPGPGNNGGFLVGAWDQDDEGFKWLVELQRRTLCDIPFHYYFQSKKINRCQDICEFWSRNIR